MVDKSESKEKIIDNVFKALNKKFKSSNQKTYRLTDDAAPNKIKKWFKTGCTPLDIAIANRPDGGIPSGRVIELTGLESSGKSLLLASIMANAQKQGAICVMIDNEFAVDEQFYRAIGLNTEELIYSQLEFMEDILKGIDEIVLTIRKDDQIRPIVIGVDSIAGAKTYDDIVNDEKNIKGYHTQLARILSDNLPKVKALCAKHDATVIFTQQLRMNLGVTYGDKYCVDPETTEIEIEYEVLE